MWIFMMKSVALGGAALLLLVAIASKRIVGSWINAASIFSLFWFAYTAFPLVFAWDVPINLGAIFYIVLFNVLFASSVVFFNWDAALQANKNKVSAHAAFGSRLLVLALFVVSTFSIVCIFQGMRLQGIEFSGNIIEFAGNYAALRYANALTENIYSKLSILLNFLVIVMGGFAWGGSRGNKLRGGILCASFAPVSLLMITQSAKGPFLLAVALFLGAALVTRVYEKKYSLIDGKSARILAKWGVACFVLVMITFLSRGVDTQGSPGSIFHSLWDYFLSYSSGHLYAFADWFSDRYFDYSLVSYSREDLTYGFYSFMSFFRIFGDDRSIPFGTYEEVYEYHGALVTNIYTAFRGLITDFSLAGSLMVGWVAGFFCNWICFGLYSERNNAFFVVAFVYFFAFAYQSFLISTFTWASVPTSFIMLVAFFWIYFGVRLSAKHVRVGEVGG